FAAAGGRLYGLSPDRSGVWQWTGKGDRWVKVGGPAQQLHEGSVTLLATSPGSGDIHRYDTRTGRWNRIGGPGRTFTAQGGRIYGLSPDRLSMWQWTGKGTRWTGSAAPQRDPEDPTTFVLSCSTSRTLLIRPAGISLAGPASPV
ncbi:hypothetical protein ACIGO6_39960, partial [Streptomyces sp. NPDC053750]|uniref:hypothetical protein n=1 Tax=Streptomyces sp. NPDC053750 TaxID=3365714 RepID=UPI0037D351BC